MNVKLGNKILKPGTIIRNSKKVKYIINKNGTYTRIVKVPPKYIDIGNLKYKISESGVDKETLPISSLQREVSIIRQSLGLPRQ